MKMKLLSVLTSICMLSTSYSQITVTATWTVQDLVQNVLMGYGVSASNIRLNGALVTPTTIIGNATYFTNTNPAFPIQSGVLLTTGMGSAAVGPNNSGSQSLSGTPNVGSDPHLSSIANASITNGIVLEFDFVPSGDTLSFNYLFGSEEYPEFAPSLWNDAFGFFLWGPGISGPFALAGYPAGDRNIATIPGTATPITINNVNATSNNAYYVNNVGGVSYGTAIQYDGTTTLLPATASVQCGEVYHIKMAIGNVGDQSYDSGVFLQANSFASDAVQVQMATFSGSDIVYEGCTDASIRFIRPHVQINDTLTINYSIGGTATMGTDYNNLPNPITFLPGQDTIVVTITSTFDGIPDNGETIIITAAIVNPCGDTIVSTGTLYILDSVVLDISHLDPLVYCINDSVPVTVSASQGFGPYTYDWSTGATGPTGYLATVDTVFGSIDYYVTATDVCGYQGVDTITVTVDQTIKIDSLNMTPATCLPVGTIFTSNFPYGAHLGNPSNPASYNLTFDWTYQSDTTMVFPNQSSLENLSGGWYILELTDNVVNCTVTDSILVEVENVPSAQLQVDPGAGCAPLTVQFTNSSQNSNEYFWDYGNGATEVRTDMNSTSQTYSVSSVIQLVASNGNVSCNDTTTVYVDIVTCGCMDPTALNYDPSAVLSDGNCVYPIPTVIPPNVVTMNGDGINELFFLETTNAETIELIIVDRWGNKVFEGYGDQNSPPIWTGKNKSGSSVSEGVYFYTYVVTGKLGDRLEGHGFLTVVK